MRTSAKRNAAVAAAAAAVVLTMLVMIALLTHKYIVSGLTAGATKG